MNEVKTSQLTSPNNDEIQRSPRQLPLLNMPPSSLEAAALGATCGEQVGEPMVGEVPHEIRRLSSSFECGCS